MEQSNEAQEEISPSPEQIPKRSRIRFQLDESQTEKTTSSLKPKSRATRFLSMADTSAQLPSTTLFKLRKLHEQAMEHDGSSTADEISDELLDKIPFKIEIISDRHDDFDFEGMPSKKTRSKEVSPTKTPLPGSSSVPTRLTEQRRLEIIQEILRDLSTRNVLDDLRQANRIPFRLPRNNQLQINVARRVEELTGSDTIMLNDPIYMKHFCEILAEKHQKELDKHYQQLASTASRYS